MLLTPSGYSRHGAHQSGNTSLFPQAPKGFRRDGEWALNISSVIVFGRLYAVEDPERLIDVCRRLSLQFTSDEEYINQEIENHAKTTLCFELRPEHMTGKIVNEAWARKNRKKESPSQLRGFPIWRRGLQLRFSCATINVWAPDWKGKEYEKETYIFNLPAVVLLYRVFCGVQ